MKQSFDKQRGTLLILTMIIIFAMSSIGFSIASVAVSKYNSARHTLYVENAVAAAEAGASATRQQLDRNDGFSGYAPANKQLLYNDPIRGKADYSTEVSNNGDGTKSITSTGYVYRSGEVAPYNTKKIRIIVKKLPQTITTPSVFAGSGGLSISNGAVGPDNASNIINVMGKVTMSNHGVIGGSSITGPSGTPTLNVANIACAQSGNYPVACPANQQPLQLSGYSRIYANVCATNQVDSRMGPFGDEGVFPPGTLQPNCTAPIASTPTFDKQAYINSMTSSSGAGSASCSGLGDNETWQANRTYTGNVSVAFFCSATVTGDVYITGNLTIDGNTTFRVQNGVTTPPTIVVNGRVTLGGLIRKNNLGVGVKIISFHSNTTGCSNAPDCVTLPAADAQASVNIRAIDCTFCTPDASILWSYFGKTYLGGPAAVTFGGPALSGIGALMGGSVEMSQYSFAFGAPTWMTVPPGTVTVLGNYSVVDYQQLFP